MERLNYTTQCIESMTSMKNGYQGDIKFIDMICNDLRDAVKFMMPHGGQVIDQLDLTENNPLTKAFGLPFEKIVIEYSIAQSPNYELQEISVPKRLVYCEAMQLSDILLKIGIRSFPQLPKPTRDKKAIYILPLNYLEESGKWFPNIAAIVLTEGLILYRSEKIFEAKGIVYVPAGKDQARIWSEAGYTYADAINDGSDDLKCFFQLMYLLDCSNVVVQTNDAPKHLNKKRLKKGKIPFFDYRVLTIRNTKKMRETKTDVVGNRKSPTPHLRRGHLRHYPNFTRFIQNMSIGGKGKMINKDYKLLY